LYPVNRAYRSIDLPVFNLKMRRDAVGNVRVGTHNRVCARQRASSGRERGRHVMLRGELLARIRSDHTLDSFIPKEVKSLCKQTRGKLLTSGEIVIPFAFSPRSSPFALSPSLSLSTPPVLTNTYPCRTRTECICRHALIQRAHSFSFCHRAKRVDQPSVPTSPRKWARAM
jgi:hypothetical protein